MTWIKISDDMYAEEGTPDPKSVVSLSELNQRLLDIEDEINANCSDNISIEVLKDFWDKHNTSAYNFEKINILNIIKEIEDLI